MSLFNPARLAGLIALLVAGVSAATAPCAAAEPSVHTEPQSTFSVEGLGKGLVSLDGPWQFHLGDNPAWAAPDFNDTTGQNGWEQLSATKTWGAQGHNSYTGYAWYRLRINIALAPGAPSDLAMLMPHVQDVYELYWNGQLIGGKGKFPPHPVWYYAPPPQTLGLGPIRSGVLAIRVWKVSLGSFDSGELGGFTSSPGLGSPQAITDLKARMDYQWLRSHQFSFGLYSLDALAALFGFLLWLNDRSQRLPLWIAAFAGSPLLIELFLGLRIQWPFVVALGWAQPVFGLIAVSSWYLLIYLLELNDNRTLMRMMRVFAIIEIIATSLDGLMVLSLSRIAWNVRFVQWTDAILTGIFTVLHAMPLILVAYAALRRRRLTHERWLVAICAFGADVIPVAASAFDQGRRFTHWHIAEAIRAPLFIVNGNPINGQSLFQALLIAAILYAVYRISHEERERKTQIELELQNARELQQVLIPETQPAIPGFLLTSGYKPALEVGGDFYQILPLENDSTLIVLGDVSGKGLKAAMAVSLIVGLIRAFAETTSSPAQILAGLNRRLFGRLQGGFATCIAIRLESDGRCVIASAGHPAPFLNDREVASSGALPLGLTPNATYEETTIDLGTSDHLALYTDGLLEARNPAGELYGFERLSSLFAAHPSAQQAVDAAVAFGQDDDITVLTLTRITAATAPDTQLGALSLTESPA
jgi:Stage II sporulation protein E (SpoIIE)